MSRHEREKLLRYSQTALDTLFEIRHMEQLTIGENKKLQLIFEELQRVNLQIKGLVGEIEERKAKEAEARGKPIPSSYDGPKFSWAKHEERASLRKELEKAQRELAKIEEMEDDLN